MDKSNYIYYQWLFWRYFHRQQKKVIIVENKENSNLTKKEQETEKEKFYGNKYIKKIIFNLIFLFYYRGMCYESLGKINY